LLKIMANCRKCGNSVGCDCNLVNGLCFSCAGVSTKPEVAPGQKAATVKETPCEITLNLLNLLDVKFSCAIDRRLTNEVGETLQTLINIQSVIRNTKTLEDFCQNRAFIQLAEQILVRINKFTDC